MSISFSPDVVVVGGGPVGLWTAIQIKTTTNKEVLVAEKYAEYKRSDINLNIRPHSLRGIPQCETLQKLAKNWSGRVVPIKEMEESLIRCANEVGVRILRGNQVDPHQLRNQFPTAKVFIGADGAKSSMRKELFGDNYKFNRTFQYLIQVQYKIKSPREAERKKSLHTSINSYRKLCYAGHLITENIRAQENGESRVTLRIFIDKETYFQMAEAKFSNPYYFETDLDRVPKKIKDILIKWWGYQEDLEIVQTPKTNKITVIPLSAYATKELIKTASDEPVIYALVGDAAQAYPFFRAINNGFLLGTKLAKCTAEAFKNLSTAKNRNLPVVQQAKQFALPFKSYSRYAILRAYTERIKVYIKNLFILLSNFWIKSASTSPVKIIQLESQKKRYFERGQEIWNSLSQSTKIAVVS